MRDNRERMFSRVVFAVFAVACCPCASALNPSLDISQYAHNAWTVRDGFFKGSITSIAQTPDGYLWLGTEFGLLRFDGVRTVPWQTPSSDHLPGTRIVRLLASRDGRLWIGTPQGLASWKDGKLTGYSDLDGQAVYSLLEDREETIWATASSTSLRKLCAIRGGHVQCYGEDGSFGPAVGALYADNKGSLWAGGVGTLWRWKPGPPKIYRLPDSELAVHALLEDDNGDLLIGLRSGIRRLVNGKTEAFPLPGGARQVNPERLLRDRNGGLWIGTAQGLLHVHRGKTDRFAQSDGLSGENVSALFEDREGNIWAATPDGLDRFRDFAVATVSLRQGLSSASAGAVLAARDGSVWLSTPDGLNRWKDGQITIYRKRTAGLPDDYVESLFQDDRERIWLSTLRGFGYFENGRFIPVSGVPGRYVHSIREDSERNLWISHNQGLFHLLGGRVVERIPWAKLGRTGQLVYLASDPLQGGLWLGFYEGGVAYFKDGHVRAWYAVSDGLGEGRVNALQLGRNGALWVATERGLSRLKNGRIDTLSGKNGLPCDAVYSVMEDDDHSLWMYTTCGLVRLCEADLQAWVEDSKRKIQVAVFDSSDGVRSHASPISNFNPRFAKSADGKLWFVHSGGVGVIDPRYLPVNQLPPPVHIEQINVDGKNYDPTRGLRLPPLIRDVSIEYTALSFVAPEKVRFRYKLEGQDRDWKEVVNDRQVQYSNLAPRNYRFRVMACNNSNVWNEAGDSFDFSIDPAYYQTRWFLAACMAAFLGLVWGLYRYRLHQIAREFDARLAERVNERTRIARDLHDTLLQSFHGLMFRFQAARNMLPRRSEEAMQALDAALERTENAIAEGRDAIQGLRASTVVTNELAQAMTALGVEMASHASSQDSASNTTRFRVVVEGPPRDLHPILRDEVYAIAREAVQNAFRHSQALDIEVEIAYNGSSFRLRVRDDGKGIDPAIVAEGRAGHYGVPGMRERAKRIGGKLDVWTEAGAGTEIELSIRGSIAYGTSSGYSVLGRFRKKAANS
jgi:ligand-binding sensor domain-containing protein/signal transduction histidine kinase